MDRSGQCLCGAVHFVIRDANSEFGACHCKMCQRWAGSVYMGLTVPTESITFEGKENISRYQSSEWAERAWCNKCGSNLWYKVTAEGAHSGGYQISVGLLDDTTGLNVTREYFVDVKAGHLQLVGDPEQFDTAAMLKMFGADQ